MLLRVGLIGVIFASAAAARADDVLPPASQRFAAASADEGETPDFQRHVAPLLSRLGCNGRACHGSFQGQGGFRLSLFGYDFSADHEALTRKTGDEGRIRVDVSSPDESLLIAKPALAIDHEGGQRFSSDGWEHRLLRAWIESGARPAPAIARLVRLEVQPAEMIFAAPGESKPLRVIAHWEDGVAEDVTSLARFESRDEDVLRADEHGMVTAAGRGDGHVIVFYDNGVAAAPVLVPVAGSPADVREIVSGNRIDVLIGAKLEKLGIAPSALCTDAEFLRRASLDITGTLPTPAEVEEFLADASSQKRGRKIDELLMRPAYAAWWANKLCDYTGNNPGRQGDAAGQELATQWYDWIRRRLEQNTPYDELAAGVVLAVSRAPGESYEEYARAMSACFHEADTADFAARPSLPHFWSRENLKTADDRALSFAHSFLGVRLQCAQCHKHPYDRWTEDDFRSFAGFFAGVTYGVAPESQEEYRRVAQAIGQNPGGQGARINPDLLAKAEMGQTLPWRELYIDRKKVSARLRLLGGEEVKPLPDDDPRRSLMAWLRRDDNPYFARAMVNRVWANYFHRGLIEPTDDLSAANPPVNAPLLDYLTKSFVAQGYDLKWLHREIATSRAYQRSWRPSETNREDRRNFSRAVPRRLPAEVVYDALAQATAAGDASLPVRDDLERRAIGRLSIRMAGTYAMRVFGKPDRVVACDCERSDEPSLLQAVFLQNDPIVRMRLEGGWLDENARGTSDRDAAELVREAYLRTVSRPPTSAETDRAVVHLKESASPSEGLGDLMWALLNSKEFLLNH
jgi:hypothetical protein